MSRYDAREEEIIIILGAEHWRGVWFNLGLIGMDAFRPIGKR